MATAAIGGERTDAIVSFATGVTALSLLSAVCAYLLPAGPMKRAAGLGAGLVFICYVIRRVIGIFAELGG